MKPRCGQNTPMDPTSCRDCGPEHPPSLKDSGRLGEWLGGEGILIRIELKTDVWLIEFNTSVLNFSLKLES